MAQQRKVIQNIEEATCENCIYSRSRKTGPDTTTWCARKYHANIGYASQPGDWCGMGVWTTQREGGDVMARGLEELYEYEWEDK
jgi:hypothetical protein